MLKYQGMTVLDCSLACNKCGIAFYMRYINLHRIIIKYICLYIFIFSKVVSKDVKQTKYRQLDDTFSFNIRTKMNGFERE